MLRLNKFAYYPCTRMIIVLLYGIHTTSRALIAVLSPCEMCLPKCRQRVILQGNMTEYYSAHDMLSTNEISNTAELMNINEV